MGIQSLQQFIETHCPGACVPVDLLKIARSVGVRCVGGVRGHFRNQLLCNRLCLVVDGECCLDRLYGGFFSDWVCGGQWNRMVQFISVLIKTIQSNNIELAVFFNGGLEQHRMKEWVKKQQSDRKKVNQVLRHVALKATPPPKVWWIPPVCLRTCLRMALRHLNVTVVCTIDDHHQEVIAFCRENNFHGIMAEDAEYAIFDPPRYFSSEQLKLTYKGSLETKEFILDEVAKTLNLHPNRFCVFAALLGNYLLSEEDLTPFYHVLCPDQPKEKPIPAEILIKAVVEFVRSIPSVENLDAVGTQIFGAVGQNKINKFKHCVQYYLNGTKDGFLHYHPAIEGHKEEPGCYPVDRHPLTSGHQQGKPLKCDVKKNSTNSSVKFASETEESESTLSAYHQATTQYGTEITKDSTNQDSSGSLSRNVNGGLLPSPSTSSCSSDSISNCYSPEIAWASKQKNKQNSVDSKVTPTGTTSIEIPRISPEVMRTASERHQKGLMSPWIYQLLSQGEIKLPVMIEEEVPRDLPPGALLFRPLRQLVYAIVFNLHHMQFMAKQKKEKEGKEEKVPDIIVKEWIWSKHKQYSSPDLVPAVSLGWAVPTIQRLWFGVSPDEKKRRMRAFLTCMRSDSPLMLNTAYVPQHMLIMCCVLRYIMSDERPILRKQELDAFLAQGVSPHLMNAQFTQTVQLPVITNRGVELAAIFMQGVECALFANDACGAPVPWLMCCPWLFFDGKLFHQKLLKASGAKNLVDICDGQLDQVSSVERMRAAILEGLNPQFSRPPLIPMGHPGSNLSNYSRSYPPMLPPGVHIPASNRGRGRGSPVRASTVAGRRMISHGGQLEVGGVVVGSWGPNYGQLPHSRNSSVPSHVSTMAGIRRYGTLATPVGRGLTYRRIPTTKIRNPGLGVFSKKKQKNKKIGKEKLSDSETPDVSPVKLPLGRGCTLETSDSQTIQVSQLIPPGDDDTTDSPLVEVQDKSGKYENTNEIMNQKSDTSSPYGQLNNGPYQPPVDLEIQGDRDHCP
ncbi:constitutive coactivator of PPAR-gamma-like protein 1 homolog isoform X2 [Limulus polyphemus]|uniref:Constitutive coactivator of PPAR-gamma-like protein 1 homolog isoform X2 n=1 Tax=Limulus polyphemus TaxID=6850 RepID=A0ABM1BD68_LIMPO|nr:constitutive coactivator of PPAR-gamma-like protein 1 homolog isoform X2 [Limulus polyphemus]